MAPSRTFGFNGTPGTLGTLVLPNVEFVAVGTTRPAAVTRIPGGEPCSLMSFSTLPRLTDGVGEGRLLDVGFSVLTDVAS